jgi:hypothetical protein
MNRLMLAALGLGAVAPAAAIAQVSQQAPFRGDSAAGATTVARNLDDRPSPVLMAIAGAAGSVGGLYVGAKVGSPLAGLYGAVVRSAVGTALGIELASQGRVPPIEAAGAALLGTLAGITSVMLASDAIHGTGEFFLAYSVPQGVLAGLVASARGGGAR